MKCRSFQKKLSACQDSELKPGEQEEISRHLRSCLSCREQYEKLERVWQTLGEMEEIRPDPWFYRQLVGKIKGPREQGGRSAVEWFPQLWRAPVIVSILLVLGILAGTYLGNILVRSDFHPFQPDRTSYSREALFDSLKAFEPAPPGTLAHGYLQMTAYREDESR